MIEGVTGANLYGSIGYFFSPIIHSENHPRELFENYLEEILIDDRKPEINSTTFLSEIESGSKLESDNKPLYKNLEQAMMFVFNHASLENYGLIFDNLEYFLNNDLARFRIDGSSLGEISYFMNCIEYTLIAMLNDPGLRDEDAIRLVGFLQNDVFPRFRQTEDVAEKELELAGMQSSSDAPIVKGSSFTDLDRIITLLDTLMTPERERALLSRMIINRMNLDSTFRRDYGTDDTTFSLS